MKTTIHTGYNKAFNWILKDNIYFIGYLSGPHLIPDAELLCQLFTDVKSFAHFKIKVQSLNGVFSIIVKKRDSLYAATCPIRYFPLFYTKDQKGDFFISDNIQHIKNKRGKNDIDPAARIEFISGAFTCEKKTLFKDIYQLRPGEILGIENGEIHTAYYYHFSKSIQDISTVGSVELEQSAKKIVDAVFDRQLSALKDRKVALALSGGYDSRLIAVKLKEFGFKNVVCFTYGLPTTETAISERVARTLGFEWHFVEYNHDLIRNFNSTEDFNHYYEYGSRGTSMFYLQEYPAIKYLIDNKIITNEYISFPGHSGGLIRGTFLIKYYPEHIDKNKMPLLLLRQKFYHSNLSKPEQGQLLRGLSTHLDELHYKPELLSYSVLEDWEIKERTSKYIFNSSHAFTFFGIQTYFPLADLDMLNFFRVLPFEERIFGRLYKRLLSEQYFKPYGLDFTDDIQPKSRAVRVDRIKRKIRPFLPKKMKQKLLQKNDWPFYGPMTQYLLDELNNNKIFPKTNYSSYLYRILEWYLMKIKEDKNSVKGKNNIQ